ncbi:hypothetical protein H5410_002418 [Solanum commersonii]|uniref:Peptidase A1 domain-containing protein n=1 Tax=Solanum commersonii TaxID=4109 RepID=A0A9J6B1Q1_SOLCO|nr:hypothetical protein H5410_002418 [Solanum commersonii]
MNSSNVDEDLGNIIIDSGTTLMFLPEEIYNKLESTLLEMIKEVENPSSFNFSIPPPDEPLSTPICRVGETSESTTPLTEVMTSPVVPSEEILPCSLTLVLFGIIVAKVVDGPSTEEVDMASKGVSSAMSERFFEGDLPEGRGPESSILTAMVELVPLSLELVFDQTPKSFVVETEMEKEEPPLKWNRTRVRGANTLTIGIPDLETADNSLKVDHIVEPTKSEKERQRKGKGKLVVFHHKGDKRKYVTRSETQKVLGSAIAASRVQTERARKRKRKGIEPERPTSTPLPISSSDTESEDVVSYVTKKRKESEKERVKTKEVQKTAKISPAKREKIKKEVAEKSRLVKGPGPNVQKQSEEKEMTREERITTMESQKDETISLKLQFRTCMNLRYVNFSTKWNFWKVVESRLLSGLLKYVWMKKYWGIILGVPVEGIRMIEGCKPSSDFTKLATKHGDVKRAGLSKKFLKGKFQLLFEFINKVLVPRTEK